jgi:hypothetical protein
VQQETQQVQMELSRYQSAGQSYRVIVDDYAQTVREIALVQKDVDQLTIQENC